MGNGQTIIADRKRDPPVSPKSGHVTNVSQSVTSAAPLPLPPKELQELLVRSAEMRSMMLPQRGEAEEEKTHTAATKKRPTHLAIVVPRTSPNTIPPHTNPSQHPESSSSSPPPLRLDNVSGSSVFSSHREIGSRRIASVRAAAMNSTSTTMTNTSGGVVLHTSPWRMVETDSQAWMTADMFLSEFNSISVVDAPPPTMTGAPVEHC